MISKHQTALFIALSCVVSTSAFAQNRPVRLSINGSALVNFKANDGSSAAGKSIAYFANDTQSSANRRTLQLRLADPVLCADSLANSTESNVRLRLVDSNNQIQTSLRLTAGATAAEISRGLQGLEAYNTNSDIGGARLRIDPADSNKRVFNISTKTSLQCFVFPSGVLAAQQPAPEAVTLSKANERVPEGDTIFVNGFEDTVSTGVDLVTSFVNLPSNLLASGTLNYQITVRNVGSGGGQEVQFRDFYPMAGVASPGLQAGTWTCTGTSGAFCSEASGTGYAFQSDATVGAGGTLTFVISRPLGASTLVGSSLRLQAAAFSRVAENEIIRTNNAISSNLVTISNNQPPTISIASNPSQQQGACPIGGASTCRSTVTVTDDQTSALNINVTADTLNASDIVIDSVSTPQASPTIRRIDYQLNSNFVGNGTIRVTAIDGSGGSSTLDLPITVTAPNSAPVITWSSSCADGGLGATLTPPNGATPATLRFTSGNDTYECDPVATVVPGPSFEAGQTIDFISVSPSPATGPIMTGSNIVRFSNSSPQAPGSRLLRLLGTVTSATSGTQDLTITIRDNGGTANGGSNTLVTTLRIVRQ